MIYSLGDKKLKESSTDFWVAPNAAVIGAVAVSYTHLRAHET